MFKNILTTLAIFTISCLLLFSCHPASYQFMSLSERQVHVTEIIPREKAILIYFSQTLDPKSISARSISFASQFSINSLVEYSVNYIEGSKLVTLEFENKLADGIYTLTINDQLRGENRIPFNQNPAADPEIFSAVFSQTFTIENESPIHNIEDETESSVPESNNPPSDNPQLNNIVINEVLYDAVGSDSDGKVFIELYGRAFQDIHAYQILLVNGEDGSVKQRIQFPENSECNAEGIYLIADAKVGSSNESNIQNPSLIINFDPQNGPDTILLLDPHQRVIDTVGYGDFVRNIDEDQRPLFEEESAIDVGAGSSLSRSQGLDTNNNQLDFIELENPSPGVL